MKHAITLAVLASLAGCPSRSSMKVGGLVGGGMIVVGVVDRAGGEDAGKDWVDGSYVLIGVGLAVLLVSMVSWGLSPDPPVPSN